MKVLEEFWYRNINPMERPFQSQRKFDKVFRLLTKNEEELLKNPNEQEKELFDKVKACYDEVIQITECQTFIKGFKLVAIFIIECYKITPTYSMNEIRVCRHYYAQNEIIKGVICTESDTTMMRTQPTLYEGGFVRSIIGLLSLPYKKLLTKKNI